MRTRLVTVSALFVTVFGLGSCGGDGSAAPPSTLAPLVTTTTVAAPPTTPAPVQTAAPITVAPSSTTTSVAQTTSTTAASTTTSTTVAPAAVLILRDDGLGDALFGADAEGVIQYITSILGVPTDDSGWGDPFESFGICPGNEVRGVTWGDLQLLFSDESVVLKGRRHFFNYVYGPPAGTSISPAGMSTANGVSIGTSVAELRLAYPNVQVYPEDIYGPYFVVNDDLIGFLTGVSDTDEIISFIGGTGCGE